MFFHYLRVNLIFLFPFWIFFLNPFTGMALTKCHLYIARTFYLSAREALLRTLNFHPKTLSFFSFSNFPLLPFSGFEFLLFFFSHNFFDFFFYFSKCLQLILTFKAHIHNFHDIIIV